MQFTQGAKYSLLVLIHDKTANKYFEQTFDDMEYVENFVDEGETVHTFKNNDRQDTQIAEMRIIDCVERAAPQKGVTRT